MAAFTFPATVHWANQMNPELRELPTIEAQTELEQEAKNALFMALVGMAGMLIPFLLPAGAIFAIIGLRRAKKVKQKYKEQYLDERNREQKGFKMARWATVVGIICLFAMGGLLIALGLYIF